MNPDNAVVELPTVAIVLPADTHRILAALRRARLVDAANRLGVGVVFGHDLLAAISQFFFIPLDRLEETL